MPQTRSRKLSNAISRLNRSEKILDLSKSFLQAIQCQDFPEATRIATQLRPFTDKSEDRHLLMFNEVISNISTLLNPEFFKDEKLMIQCSWILGSVASEGGICVKHIMAADIPHKALDLMGHPSNEVKQNVVWLLASVAEESKESRDELIELGVIDYIGEILSSAILIPGLISKVALLISSLVKAGFDVIENNTSLSELAAYTSFVMSETNDQEALRHGLKAMSFITALPARCKFLYRSSICSKIISFIKETGSEHQIFALSILHEMCRTDDTGLLMVFLQSGLLDTLYELLHYPDEQSFGDSCIVLVHFVGKSSGLTQEVLDFKDGQLIKDIMKMSSSVDSDVRYSCLCFISQVFINATIQQAKKLLSLDVLEYLSEAVPKCDEMKYNIKKKKLVLLGLVDLIDIFRECPKEQQLIKSKVLKMMEMTEAELILDVEKIRQDKISTLLSILETETKTMNELLSQFVQILK